MDHADRGSALAAYLVAGPQPAETRAGQGQLAGELDEARVVDVVADRLAQVGDEAFGDVLPLRVPGLLGRVEEQVAHLVAACGEAGGEGAGQTVRGEDVEV